jgi:predicted metal-dependent hydrolase
LIIQEEDSTLRIANEAIPMHILKGRPNRVRLSFAEDNKLQVETSNGKLGDFDRQFLHSKVQWILRGYRKRRSAHERKHLLLMDIERNVPLFGKPHPVVWHASHRTYFQFDRTGPFEVFAPEKYLGRHRRKVLYFAIRKFSEMYLAHRVEHWAKVTGIQFHHLRVKELKTKWGSCSTLRNINLNWQLVLLSETLIDYVIIHELMHLHEMNHSPRFWAWVGKYYPEYKRAKAQLKEEQWMVGILN